jgi:RNA polymerase sigma-70 factor (ECF subfamily)
LETKAAILPEQELLNGLKRHEITAYEMIFKSYYQPLCNYAYSYLQDHDEAEEVVQSTFLSIWEKKDSLEIRSSLKSYLYAMVRNASLNMIKHQKIKQRYAGEELELGKDSEESVSNQVASLELEKRIEVALSYLPEQCRLIFKLSRFEELKYAEIADQLNISVKTVENQMGKALRIMREQLKDYLPLLFILFNGFLN